MEATTTVAVKLTTWRRLQELRERPAESMDQVIARLIKRESAQEQPQKAAS